MRELGWTVVVFEKLRHEADGSPAQCRFTSACVCVEVVWTGDPQSTGSSLCDVKGSIHTFGSTKLVTYPEIEPGITRDRTQLSSVELRRPPTAQRSTSCDLLIFILGTRPRVSTWGEFVPVIRSEAEQAWGRVQSSAPGQHGRFEDYQTVLLLRPFIDFALQRDGGWLGRLTRRTANTLEFIRRLNHYRVPYPPKIPFVRELGGRRLIVKPNTCGDGFVPGPHQYQ